jgi:1L-myo-inositol 1-phosphate cytidylyltransferase / CDP-L-myo-inositol myo-inositolphosphotransferase
MREKTRPFEFDGASGSRRGPRTGVILAAGKAERLASLTEGRSKALIPLGGVTLIERAIRTLLGAGLERVVVVVGHQGDMVAASARNVDPDRVEVVAAEAWEAGNGSSLAAAERAVNEEDLFIVMCADHVFAEGALKSLLAGGEPAVLVDRSPSAVAWSEGTRVHIRRGQAEGFGKDLDHPSIDCGVFVLPPEVFASRRRAATRGDHSLAGAVTDLARTRTVRAVPLPAGAWWQDIDTPEDLRAARRLLQRSLGKRSDGPISRHLNRPLSTRLTLWLAPFRLNPNLLSLGVLLVGLWAAWSLSASRALVGGLLVQLASILDGVDGETARLHYRTSRLGHTLDDVSDRVTDAAIVAGLCLWVWDDPSRTFRTVILAASAVGLAAIHLLVRRATAHLEVPALAQRPVGVSLGGRDGRLFAAAIGAVLDQPWLALSGFASVYLYSVVRRVASVRHWKGLAPRAPSPPHEIGQAAQGDLYEVR